jgi:hypothetical protein
MQLSAKIRFIAAAAFTLATVLQAQTPQHAQVTYTSGKLYVAANNSSLNQILHDIGHETGMKITGGVTDERVFGQYGPASPAKVLGQLLDGTGSNMLLVHATTAAPAELVLTPRHGVATPPNPEAYREEPPPPPVRPQYPIMPAEENAPPPPAAPQSPNAVKTPQQIYEQLQRMRQQQAPSNPQ